MIYRSAIKWLSFLLTFLSVISSEVVAQKYIGTRLELLSPSVSNIDALYPIDLENADWVRSTVNVPNLGNTGSWVWARLDLDPVAEAGLNVEIAYPTIDSLQVFMICDGVINSTSFAGATVPKTSRDQLLGNYPSFPIPVSDCEKLTCYIRAWSGKQLLLPVRIEGSRKLLSDGHLRDVFFAIYFGVVISLLLYNLFLFFSVRDKNYLQYVLFIIAVGGTQLVLNGYDRVFDLVSSPWVSLRMTHIFGILSGVFSILFVRNFLHLKTNAPGYHRIFGWFYVPYFISAVLLFFGYFNMSYDLINIPALMIILLIPASIKVWRTGDISAAYFLVGWLVFILAVAVFVLKDYGVIPYNEATIYALPTGSAIELVVLSLALGSRINQLKKDRQRAREKELNTSLLNEKIQKEQNVILEKSVNERTSELREINDSLQATLEDLRSAQQQLIQSEKLASIGQLTAGIAHELNNPINFVSSNAQSLKRDFIDVKEIISLISNLDSESSSLKEDYLAVCNKMSQLDIPFTMNEIDELLLGVEDGANRTTEIVRGLRIFSRMDGNQTVMANLNELLSSTLIILRSNLKDEADVIVELSENVPDISCQPGKLNQVFMNIITNAAHATMETELPRSDRTVRVRTRLVKDKDSKFVQVEISDNGVGMSEQTQAQIFNPFYTTKEVGKGTGLGLSIVKGILDDHNATIEISSKVDDGTTFLLSFPL
jgi:signal transduction histidine kinase